MIFLLEPLEVKNSALTHVDFGLKLFGVLNLCAFREVVKCEIQFINNMHYSLKINLIKLLIELVN